MLGKFGFCGDIRIAISVLYSYSAAHVFAEGFFSEQFSITNETRQGSPLFPLIFVLLMKPLAEFFLCHPDITGIAPRKEQHTISLFADNVILSLANSSFSLSAVHNIFQNFDKISYYKIN